LMRRFDWSRPAFLIGFVLANPVENYANNANQIAGIRFRNGMEAGLAYIFSPIVLTLLVITIVSVIVGLRKSKNIMAEGAVVSGQKRAPVMFLIAVLGFIIFALVNLASIPNYAFVDAVFPLFVASVSFVAGLTLLVQMMLKPESDAVFADRAAEAEEYDMRFKLWPTLGWFAGLLLATSLLGFILALAGFLVLFFHFRAQVTPFKTMLLSVSGVIFMCWMAWLLNRDFPPGLLQYYVALPWPLT